MAISIGGDGYLEDALHTGLAEVVAAGRGQGLLQDPAAHLALELLQRLLVLRQLQGRRWKLGYPLAANSKSAPILLRDVLQMQAQLQQALQKTSGRGQGK